MPIVIQMQQAARNTDDPRMQALAAASAALSIKNAADAVQTGMANPDANPAQQAGGVNLSLSIGTSKTSSSRTEHNTSAQSSQLIAGGDINVNAHGAGLESDVTILGSQLKASGDISLQAEDQLNLKAAENTSSLTGKNKGSSASVGISFGTDGLLLNVGASGSKGKTNATDTHWTESVIESHNKVSLQSGTDTNIIGSQVKGKQVEVEVGSSGQGNLNIESLQDSSQFKDKQKSMGGSVSIGYGKMGGSFSASNSKIKSDYTSVNEQAGILAGDDGFQLKVQGNTDLKGAVIASSQAAIDANKNSLNTETLTSSNINNQAEYKANAISATIGGGSQAGLPVLSGAGKGGESDHSSSTTYSAISDADINITDDKAQQTLTGQHKEEVLAALNRDVIVNEAGNAVTKQGLSTDGKLERIFDADKVAKEINAQVKITEAFTQQAYREVGQYVQQQREKLNDKRKTTTSEEEKVEIENRLEQLKLEERVLNILIGAVTGMGGTAFTKEGLSTAADEMRKLMIKDSEKFKGVIDSEGNILNNLTGESEGVRGDGKKVGGTRVDLDVLCGEINQRCAVEKDKSNNEIKDKNGIPVLKLNSDGLIDFIAENEDGSEMSISDFIKTNKGEEMVGATGGVQGMKGTLFGKPYEVGSWQDKLIEAFSGSHDYIGGSLSGLYDEDGNATRNRSELEKILNERWAEAAIPLASPFAASELLLPAVWQAIAILLKGAK